MARTASRRIDLARSARGFQWQDEARLLAGPPLCRLGPAVLPPGALRQTVIMRAPNRRSTNGAPHGRPPERRRGRQRKCGLCLWISDVHHRVGLWLGDFGNAHALFCARRAERMIDRIHRSGCSPWRRGCRFRNAGYEDKTGHAGVRGRDETEPEMAAGVVRTSSWRSGCGGCDGLGRAPQYRRTPVFTIIPSPSEWACAALPADTSLMEDAELIGAFRKSGDPELFARAGAVPGSGVPPGRVDPGSGLCRRCREATQDVFLQVYRQACGLPREARFSTGYTAWPGTARRTTGAGSGPGHPHCLRAIVGDGGLAGSLRPGGMAEAAASGSWRRSKPAPRSIDALHLYYWMDCSLAEI